MKPCLSGQHLSTRLHGCGGAQKESGHLRCRILSVASPLQMQMKNSCVNILDLAIPSTLEDMSICSDSCPIQHGQQLPGCVWKYFVCSTNVFVSRCFKVYRRIWDCSSSTKIESWPRLQLIFWLICKCYIYYINVSGATWLLKGNSTDLWPSCSMGHVGTRFLTKTCNKKCTLTFFFFLNCPWWVWQS